MNNPGRPLSPHLGIYRWPITMALSILHRLTGIANAAGFLVLTLWLTQLAAGPDDYQSFTAVLASLPGRVLLAAWTLSFFYHLCNGIRHFVWDTGRGLEVPAANASSYAVIAAAVALTSVFWAVALWS